MIDTIRRKSFSLFIAFLLSVFTFSSSAQTRDVINVLVAHNPGVSPGDLVFALVNSNIVMDGTFDSGSDPSLSFSIIGTPTQLTTSICENLSSEGAANCAMNNNTLKNLRTANAADVVVLGLNNITNDCGAVPPSLINTFSVSDRNWKKAYVVLDESCLPIESSPSDRDILAHELSHIL